MNKGVNICADCGAHHLFVCIPIFLARFMQALFSFGKKDCVHGLR